MAQTTTKNELKVEELFSLSDALQMELKVTGDEQIDGKMKQMISVPTLGLSLPFTLEVVSSRVEWSGQGKVLDVALIIQSVGMLYLVAVAERSEGKLHLFVLNSKKLSEKVRDDLDGLFEKNKQKLHPLLDAMKPAFVASFSRGDYDPKWLIGSDLLEG